MYLVGLAAQNRHLCAWEKILFQEDNVLRLEMVIFSKLNQKLEIVSQICYIQQGLRKTSHYLKNLKSAASFQSHQKVQIAHTVSEGVI